MSKNDLFVKLATADNETLKKVDDVLNHRTPTNQAEDIKTVTLTEAAKRLGVSRPTIYRMKKAGIIQGVELCGVERILLSSLVDHALKRPRTFTAI